MKKYIVETFIILAHLKQFILLNDLNDSELSKIDSRKDGEVEVIDVKLNNRKTKKIGDKTKDKDKEIKLDNSINNEISKKLKVIKKNPEIAPSNQLKLKNNFALRCLIEEKVTSKKLK